MSVSYTNDNIWWANQIQWFLDVLSSDEDDIDDANQEYLEKLQDKITRTSAQHGFNVNATIQDGHGDHRSDDDDDDSEYDGNEETALESYTTPLDSDDSNQDEYVVFKEVIQSKYLKYNIRDKLISSIKIYIFYF